MPTGIPVRTMRELFRNLQAWNSLYESNGLDTITAPDGEEYCLHDIVRLYEHAVPRLSERQKQAIELFLIQNRPEREVACLMGVSENNPVASYATQGMVRINAMIEDGGVPGYGAGAPLPQETVAA